MADDCRTLAFATGTFGIGLGAFGQVGVERVLEILRTETHAVMQQIGAPSIKHLTPSMVRLRPPATR